MLFYIKINDPSFSEADVQKSAAYFLLKVKEQHKISQVCYQTGIIFQDSIFTM